MYETGHAFTYLLLVANDVINAISAVHQGNRLVHGLRPRLPSRQPADYQRPHFVTVSVLLLAATSTPTCQVVADI